MDEAGDLNAARLGDLDALLWAVERDPRLLSTIGSVAVFEPAVRPDALRSRVDRTSRIVHRLRQRVVGNPFSLSPPRWEFDPDFDLDRHLTVAEWPGDGSMRALFDHAGTQLSSAFDRDHPLWHFELLTHPDGNRSALVMKAHHAIADGLGMLMIQAEMFDFEPDTDDPEDLPDELTAEPLSNRERLANALGHERRRGLGAMVDIVSAVAAPSVEGTVDNAVATAASSLRALQPVEPLSPVLKARSSDTWVSGIELSLDELKAAGRAAGTRMNAAFVAAVGLGIGAFHDEVGAPTARLRMGMPVSRRTEGEETEGNFFAPVRVELPVSSRDPLEMVQIVDALIDSHRDEPAMNLLAPAADLLSRLPAPVGGALFAQVLRGSDFLTSNVPGSPLPMWIGEASLVAQYPFGPTNAAAVNVTLLSYGDLAHVGIAVDAEATDQPELLAGCLERAFADVVALAH